jgi:hypothetical protein
VQFIWINCTIFAGEVLSFVLIPPSWSASLLFTFTAWLGGCAGSGLRPRYKDDLPANGVSFQKKVSMVSKCLTLTPYSAARLSNIDDARWASAATVSDGFTQSEVGMLDASVTKMPGWPRSSC